MKLAIGMGIFSLIFMITYIFKSIGEDVIEYIEKQKSKINLHRIANYSYISKK